MIGAVLCLVPTIWDIYDVLRGVPGAGMGAVLFGTSFFVLLGAFFKERSFQQRLQRFAEREIVFAARVQEVRHTMTQEVHSYLPPVRDPVETVNLKPEKSVDRAKLLEDDWFD